MARDDYVEDLTLRLVEHIHEKVKDSVRPQVNVEETARQLERIIRQKLKTALNKSLNNLEQRFFKYADKCVDVSENRQFIQISRLISRAENDVDANFNEGQTQTGIGRGDIHGQLLKQCFYDLVDNLDLLGTQLLDILHEKHIMSDSDDRSIREKTSSRDRNNEFVDIICNKLSPEEFNETFLPALEKNHPHLFTKLVGKLSEIEESYEEKQCLSCRLRNNVQVHRLAKPLLKKGSIQLPLHADLCRGGLSNRCKWAELVKNDVKSEDIIEALQNKYPNYYNQFKQNRTTSLECRCLQEPKEKERDDSDVVDYPFVRADPSYQPSEDPSTIGSEVEMRDVQSYLLESVMSETNEKEYPVRKGGGRGICLIINNKKFSNQRFRARSGSEIDVEKLCATFTRLGFLVVKEVDLTSDHIRARIREFSKDTDFSEHDAFICCLLTHGNNDILYGTDGSSIPLSEITFEFTSRECPSLAGKPKIFFVQADRGKTRMQGFKLPTEMAEAGEGVQVVADRADFLIGYCTPHGYASYRSGSTGSWYIKTLCEVLDENSDRHDLLTNLVEVNSRVARSVGHHGEKQIPAPMFTLTKSLHLTIDPSIAESMNEV